MRSIRKQARAELDLVDIWIYTCDRWSEEQADRYLDELGSGIEQLRQHPELGPRCDFIREGYRSLQVNRHVVYYTVGEFEVTVVRVLHQRMRPRLGGS